MRLHLGFLSLCQPATEFNVITICKIHLSKNMLPKYIYQVSLSFSFYNKNVWNLKYPSKPLRLWNSHKPTNSYSKSKHAKGFLILKFCWIAYQDLNCMKYSKVVFFFSNLCVQFDVELWPIISSEIWGVSNWKPVLKKNVPQRLNEIIGQSRTK